MEPVHLGELAALARERMEPMAWDYYAGGARDEITLGENRRAWDRLRLHYRFRRLSEISYLYSGWRQARLPSRCHSRPHRRDVEFLPRRREGAYQPVRRLAPGMDVGSCFSVSCCWLPAMLTTQGPDWHISHPP